MDANDCVWDVEFVPSRKWDLNGTYMYLIDRTQRLTRFGIRESTGENLQSQQAVWNTGLLSYLPLISFTRLVTGLYRSWSARSRPRLLQIHWTNTSIRRSMWLEGIEKIFELVRHMRRTYAPFQSRTTPSHPAVLSTVPVIFHSTLPTPPPLLSAI